MSLEQFHIQVCAFDFDEPIYHIYSYINRGIALVCTLLGVQKFIVAFYGKQEFVYDEKIFF